MRRWAWAAGLWLLASSAWAALPDYPGPGKVLNVYRSRGTPWRQSGVPLDGLEVPATLMVFDVPPPELGLFTQTASQALTEVLWAQWAADAGDVGRGFDAERGVLIVAVVEPPTYAVRTGTTWSALGYSGPALRREYGGLVKEDMMYAGSLTFRMFAHEVSKGLARAERVAAARGWAERDAAALMAACELGPGLCWPGAGGPAGVAVAGSVARMEAPPAWVYVLPALEAGEAERSAEGRELVLQALLQAGRAGERWSDDALFVLLEEAKPLMSLTWQGPGGEARVKHASLSPSAVPGAGPEAMLTAIGEARAAATWRDSFEERWDREQAERARRAEAMRAHERVRTRQTGLIAAGLLALSGGGLGLGAWGVGAVRARAAARARMGALAAELDEAEGKVARVHDAWQAMALEPWRAQALAALAGLKGDSKRMRDGLLELPAVLEGVLDEAAARVRGLKRGVQRAADPALSQARYDALIAELDAPLGTTLPGALGEASLGLVFELGAARSLDAALGLISGVVAGLPGQAREAERLRGLIGVSAEQVVGRERMAAVQASLEAAGVAVGWLEAHPLQDAERCWARLDKAKAEDPAGYQALVAEVEAADARWEAQAARLLGMHGEAQAAKLGLRAVLAELGEGAWGPVQDEGLAPALLAPRVEAAAEAVLRMLAAGGEAEQLSWRMAQLRVLAQQAERVRGLALRAARGALPLVEPYLAVHTALELRLARVGRQFELLALVGTDLSALKRERGSAVRACAELLAASEALSALLDADRRVEALDREPELERLVQAAEAAVLAVELLIAATLAAREQVSRLVVLAEALRNETLDWLAQEADAGLRGSVEREAAVGRAQRWLAEGDAIWLKQQAILEGEQPKRWAELLEGLSPLRKIWGLDEREIE